MEFLNDIDFELPRLKQLDMSGSKLVTLRGEYHRYLPHLRVLLLKNCHGITNVDGIQHFYELEELNIAGTAITNIEPLLNMQPPPEKDSCFYGRSHAGPMLLKLSCDKSVEPEAGARVI